MTRRGKTTLIATSRGGLMGEHVRTRRSIPFEFVFDYLYPKHVTVKQMFGCFAIYIGERIVLVLRDRTEHPADNGIWLATNKEHHESLKKEFPLMRSIKLLGKGITGWQVIPSSADDFESAAIHACECVVKGDPRIGRVPERRKRKTTKTMRGRKRAPSSEL